MKQSVHSLAIFFLRRYSLSSRWSEAVRLCRFVKEDSLWASLAASAAHAKHLETAETAYAALQQADKVKRIMASIT